MINSQMNSSSKKKLFNEFEKVFGFAMDPELLDYDEPLSKKEERAFCKQAVLFLYEIAEIINERNSAALFEQFFEYCDSLYENTSA